jgi:hypothetical protein
MRFVRILKDKWKWLKGTWLFSMFSRLGLCASVKMFVFSANEIGGLVGLNLFS